MLFLSLELNFFQSLINRIQHKTRQHQQRPKTLALGHNSTTMTTEALVGAVKNELSNSEVKLIVFLRMAISFSIKRLD